MCHRFALIATALLCCQTIARAAEPATNASLRPQPERWLLIVDTSSAMERRAKAVEGIVGELLNSGMNGQMAAGADLGIWTYNKELYAGVAPMQTWEPSRSNIIAGRSVEFLSRQNYRSKSKPELVVAELSRVVADSRQLTVVWLSDSAQKMSGTPFDDIINTAYAKYRPALAKTRMPLVTVLRVYRGKYFAQNISVAPWPIEFPPFPIEVEKTNVSVNTIFAVAKPVAPVKSIFISREPEKPEPVVPGLVEMKGGDIKLRPPPEGVAADVAPALKPVEATPLPPVPAAEPVPAMVPVEPAPVVKLSAPKPIEVAAVAPPVVAPSAAAPVAVVSRPVSPSLPVAVVAPTVPARNWPLVLGIGCLALALVAALVLARRNRRPKPISLITRSFDRDRK